VSVTRRTPRAAEERPRSDRKVRPPEGPEGREVSASELVHALGGKEVLETVLAEVTDVAVHERGRRVGHEHLPSVTRSCDAHCAVDIDAHVSLVRHKWRPRVEADAHLHRTRRERLCQLGSGGEGCGCILECEEERVALRVDLHAVVAGARLANDSPVRCERLAVSTVPQFVQELRGARDVGEEKGDGPGRKVLTHGA
jgi:hypothetical protein